MLSADSGVAGWGRGFVAEGTADGGRPAGLAWAQASCLCHSAAHGPGAARGHSRRGHPPGAGTLRGGSPTPPGRMRKPGALRVLCLDCPNLLALKGAPLACARSSEPRGHTTSVCGCVVASRHRQACRSCSHRNCHPPWLPHAPPALARPERGRGWAPTPHSSSGSLPGCLAAGPRTRRLSAEPRVLHSCWVMTVLEGLSTPSAQAGWAQGSGSRSWSGDPVCGRAAEPGP